jgi:hypothetical protein
MIDRNHDEKRFQEISASGRCSLGAAVSTTTSSHTTDPSQPPTSEPAESWPEACSSGAVSSQEDEPLELVADRAARAAIAVVLDEVHEVEIAVAADAVARAIGPVIARRDRYRQLHERAEQRAEDLSLMLDGMRARMREADRAADEAELRAEEAETHARTGFYQSLLDDSSETICEQDAEIVGLTDEVGRLTMELARLSAVKELADRMLRVLDWLGVEDIADDHIVVRTDNGGRAVVRLDEGMENK